MYIHSPPQRNDPNARVVIKVSSFYWLAANNFDWPASIYNVVVLVGVLLLFVSRILTCHIQHASNMARRALQIKIKMFHSEIKKERKNLFNDDEECRGFQVDWIVTAAIFLYYLLIVFILSLVFFFSGFDFNAATWKCYTHTRIQDFVTVSSIFSYISERKSINFNVYNCPIEN